MVAVPREPIEVGVQTRARSLTLFVLLLTYAFGFVDRTIVLTLGEALKTDLDLSDRQLGFLGGTTFAVSYTLLTLPIARMAERRSRTTILAVCVGLWSLMTAACGLAQNFAQLVLARVGVGVGEAGGQPATHSMIADMYPPSQRGMATAVFQLGVPIGILAGALAGGWITQHVGWRAAFVLVGAPGIVLALALKFLVSEPARGASEAAPPADALAERAPSLSAVVERLGRSGVFVHVFIGALLCGLASNGIAQFEHPFFLRSFDLGYARAALIFGLLQSMSLGLGIMLGGFACDRLGARNPRLQAFVPALCVVLGGPLNAIGFHQTAWEPAAAAIFAGSLLGAVYFSPIYTITHGLLEPRMRATGAAVLTVGLGLISIGLGPLLAGVTSDLFAGLAYAGGDYAERCNAAAAHAPACRAAAGTGLRYAMVLWSLIPVWGGLHLFLAGRGIGRRNA